jgi:hypothetical protein
VLDGRGKSILDGVLGNIDAPERPRQDGYGAAVFKPEHAGNVRLGRAVMCTMVAHSSPVRPG